jgi:hypothetical protein
MRDHLSASLFRKPILAAAVALAAVFMFTNLPHLRADDDDCQRRIAKADHNLHEAVEHHGYQSKQADHWRHELHEAREHCWNNGHRWWSEDDHRWHIERDWDDHDHDHDGDHR